MILWVVYGTFPSTHTHTKSLPPPSSLQFMHQSSLAVRRACASNDMRTNARSAAAPLAAASSAANTSGGGIGPSAWHASSFQSRLSSVRVCACACVRVIARMRLIGFSSYDGPDRPL